MIDEYGFKEIKLKGGVLEPDDEIETIKALRGAFGKDYPLRIDPNCAWSVETSVSNRHGPRGRNSPTADTWKTPPHRSKGWRRFDAGCLIAASRPRRPRTLPSPALPTCRKRPNWMPCRSCFPIPHYWGGVRNQQRLSFLCEVLGLGLSMHSNNHLGVSMMTMAHAAAASTNLTHACDTHYPWQTNRTR